MFERFQAHRAKVLERRAVSALASALNTDWAHGGVSYLMPGPDGKPQRFEADAVLRADSLIVLVESKAGALAPSARRAAPDRLERGLRDLVQAAATQLRRDEDALVRGEADDVRDQHGKSLTLDMSDILRVIRIAVTLEDLSSVAPATWRLQEAGVLPSDETTPWIVGIHELELICRLVERPAQLVHYILRRGRANRQRIWGVDEMDFFMRYLQDGLFWRDDELRGTALELHNHTDPLDAWWFAELGLGKPARKPRQRLNAQTRQLLGDLEETKALGRMEAQVMVLELAKQERERIANGLKSLLRSTKKDGQPHDMTLVFGQDFAITLHSLPAALAPEAAQRLEWHGTTRSSASNPRRWMGLTAVVGGEPRIHALGIIVVPERLGEGEPDSGLAPPPNRGG